MSNELLRAAVGLVVLAHGVGHVLFMPLAYSLMRIPESGHSWLVSGAVGDGVAHLVATAIGAVALVLFVVAGWGVLVQAAWWRRVAIVGAVVSALLIVVFWDGVPTSSAVFALAFDVLVLAALLVAHWPSESIA